MANQTLHNHAEIIFSIPPTKQPLIKLTAVIFSAGTAPWWFHVAFRNINQLNQVIRLSPLYYFFLKGRNTGWFRNLMDLLIPTKSSNYCSSKSLTPNCYRSFIHNQSTMKNQGVQLCLQLELAEQKGNMQESSNLAHQPETNKNHLLTRCCINIYTIVHTLHEEQNTWIEQLQQLPIPK